MEQGIEREFKFGFHRYENIEKFINYKNTSFAKWEKSFSVERVTVWFDDLNYTLKNNGVSFSLVLNSSLLERGKNKFKLKINSSELTEDELLEFTYEFDSYLNYREQMNIFWDELPVDISSLYNHCREMLEPVLYIKQTRNKRSLLVNDKRLFISADICKFFDPITNILLGEKYICELESGEETGLLTRKDVASLINYILEECKGFPISRSKLDIGLKMVENSNWKPEISLIDIKNILSSSIKVITDKNKKEYHDYYKKILFLEIECYKESKYHIFLPKIFKLKSIFYLLIYNEEYKLKYNQFSAVSREFSMHLAKINNLKIPLSRSEGGLAFERKLYGYYLSSKKQEVRKNTYKIINSELKNMSDELLSLVHVAQNQAKGIVFDSYAGSELIYNCFKNKNRYFLPYYLKKYEYVNKLRSMFVNDYSIYDIQYPLLFNNCISYSKIKKIVKNSIKEYSEKYASMFHELCESNQISYNKNSSVNTTFSNELNEPIVSVVKTGTVRDLMSFSHEIGHAIAIKNISDGSSYDMIPEIIQELHSNIFELLVINNVADRDMFVELYLEKYRNSFIRQQMISEFEIIIDSKESLTDSFIDINQLYRKYFHGVNLVYDCEYEFLKNKLLVNRPFISEIYSTSFILACYFLKKIKERCYTLEDIFSDSLRLSIQDFFEKYQILDNYNQILEENLSDYGKFINEYKKIFRRDYD